MIIALDLTSVRDFSSKYDSGGAKTTFKIGVIDSLTRAKIEDNESEFVINQQDSSKGADVKINRRQRNLQIVRYGLKGWENLKDGQGNDVPFQSATEPGPDGTVRTVAADGSLKMLPPEVIAELAGEIMSSNVLSEEDRKN
jgi:hypothetical protein